MQGNRKLFLLITAIVETATGLCILVLPSVAFVVLLGLDHAAIEALFVARLFGAALIALGVASWIARADARSPAQFGLLTGLLIYNVAASILIAYAGLGLKMTGVLLWPAVGLHVVMTAWCCLCLQPQRPGSR